MNAIAIIGNAGTYTPSFSSSTILNNASDGLVSLTSASVGFVTEQASVTRIVPYCQVDPSAFTTTSLGTFACDAPGIANVTSTSQHTGEIVRSFLGGTTDWMSIGTTPATDPYLSANGGMFFGLVSAADAYVADLSAVAWGTVELANGGDTSTIFYSDFIAGTGIFEATSASLGAVDCGSYALPVGYFSAARCKFDATIVSVGPLLTTLPKVVSSGGTITITGADFGSQCNGCKVTAAPGRRSHGANPANRLVEKHRDHGSPSRDVHRPDHHHGGCRGGDRFHGDYGGFAESVYHCCIAGGSAIRLYSRANDGWNRSFGAIHPDLQ